MKDEIRFYLSIFLRRIHYFLVVVGLVSAAGLTVATILPPVYRAEAVLLVEGAQIPGDLASSTVRMNVAQQMQIIEQRLLTRAELLQVADELGIYTNRAGLNPDAIISDLRKRIIIQPRLGSRGNNTIIVGFEGGNAVKTAEVANALVTRILNENVRLRTGRATQTLGFFEEAAARLSKAIDRKSAEILEFKLANRDALPESLEYRRARQAELQQRKVQLQRDADNIRERRRTLVELFERTGRVEPVSENLTPEQRQLRNLQNELDSALLVYSEQNPRVRVLQTRIAALETAVAGQLAAEGEGDEGPSMFDIQMADLDSQLQNIADEEATIETELAELKTSIEDTPTNSIRLGELEREFSNIRSQYTAAASRLADAAMGERIEVTSKGQRISLLEQAIVPKEPASPNRPLIAAASVGGGVGLGFGLIVLLELLNTAVRRPVDISSKIGIMPIATFPFVRTRRQRVIRRVIILSTLALVMIGLPATIWALHTYYLPLDLLIEKVMDEAGMSTLIEQLKGGLGQ